MVLDRIPKQMKGSISNVKWTKIKHGVGQGCVLSPHLFSLPIWCKKKEKVLKGKFKINGYNICSRKYDDVVLIDHSEKDLCKTCWKIKM